MRAGESGQTTGEKRGIAIELPFPPSPNRWRERSRFYPGIADAMADQWGAYAERSLAA